MINPDDYTALKQNNFILLKSNTQLNAYVVQMKKDHEDFKKETMKKLESTMRYYDRCNEKVLKFLSLNIPLNGNQYKEIQKMFPTKIEGK